MAARAQRGSGWRSLGAFWLAVIVLAAGGGTALQVLGPPPPASTSTASTSTPEAAPQSDAATSLAPHPPASQASAPRAVAEQAAPAPAVLRPDEIAAPIATLLEPSPFGPAAMLPRIGPRGVASRTAYARAAPPTGGRPRIALLVTGLGFSAADSRAAIDALPGPISLAFTPYPANLEPLEDAARHAGHEMLVSIPMESDGYPMVDAGTRSLLTGAAPAENAANLQWSLTRLQGYVGATGAMEGMRGERYGAQLSLMTMLLDELKRRGLLYIDPRPGKDADLLAGVPGRVVDLVVDDPPARAEIEAKLAALERLARDRGSALGLAGPLRPLVVERIASWARGLDARGIALVPVSALVNAGAEAQTPRTSDAAH